MKNLKLGKIIKKSITLIVTLAFACSMLVSAAVTLDADVTKDDATLTVSCGKSFARKNVVVQIFNPTASLEDLVGDGNYNETDAEIIENALDSVYHGILDDNGEVTFTVAPKGPKGLYGVRISVKGIYEVTEKEFIFSSDDDAQQVIDKLVADLDADAVAEVLKNDTEVSERVYQPHQILGLKPDVNSYYAEYLANEGIMANINANIATNFAGIAEATPASFISIFEDAVVVENVNALTGETLRDYIEAKADYLGLTDRNEYKTIYGDENIYNEANKAALASALEKISLSGKKPAEVADIICEQIFVNLFPKKDDAPGDVDRFISNFADNLKENGADIDAYKAFKKPLDLCVEIAAKAPFDTFKSVADAINAALKANENAGSSVTQPSKPSGDGGSIKSEASSSGSGGGTSYTPKKEQPKEPAKESVKEETSKNTFTDVASNHWAFEAVEALKTKGIVAGKGDGSFAPNDNVTREEFVKMLVGILGLEIDNIASANLADVNGTEWFAPYIYAAYNSGIVNGVGEGFGVGQNITRQDMAVLCARAIENKGVTLNAVRDNMTFADSISDYAVSAVEKLWKAGLVNGKSETEFAPKATATRAEAAKMLYEVFKALK